MSGLYYDREPYSEVLIQNIVLSQFLILAIILLSLYFTRFNDRTFTKNLISASVRLVSLSILVNIFFSPPFQSVIASSVTASSVIGLGLNLLVVIIYILFFCGSIILTPLVTLIFPVALFINPRVELINFNSRDYNLRLLWVKTIKIWAVFMILNYTVTSAIIILTDIGYIYTSIVSTIILTWIFVFYCANSITERNLFMQSEESDK